MGYIKHHAIVVVGHRWSESVRGNDKNTEIDDALRAACAAGCIVTPVVEGQMNGTFSFMVAPDGSKEGWDTSNDGDAARAKFITWLRAHSPESAGWFSWAEIVIGPDDAEAHVERHAWVEETS